MKQFMWQDQVITDKVYSSEGLTSIFVATADKIFMNYTYVFDLRRLSPPQWLESIAKYDTKTVRTERDY